MAAGRARGSRQRRVSLPGVAELLRPVGPGPATDSGRQASGREAHPQKITVYLAADEFLELERARLALRAHGIAVDRGRLVREAIALLMTDLGMGIDTSVIAHRLRAASEPADAPGAPANGARASGGSFGAVLADGAAAVGGSVGGILAGGLAASGSPGILASGGPSGIVPAGDGPVIGILASGILASGIPASGIPAAGLPEGPQ